MVQIAMAGGYPHLYLQTLYFCLYAFEMSSTFVYIYPMENFVAKKNRKQKLSFIYR